MWKHAILHPRLYCVDVLTASIMNKAHLINCLGPLAQPNPQYCGYFKPVATPAAHVSSLSTQSRTRTLDVRNFETSCGGTYISRHVMPRAQQQEAAAASNTISVLVPIADGSEEMEAVIIIDTLRRAGAQVTVASVEGTPTVTCSRGVRLVADGLIDDYKHQLFDAISIPGGMPGAERLRDCGTLKNLLVAQAASDRLITAICAAPAVVLEGAGLLEGRQATCHPAFLEQLSDQSKAESRVVVDGCLITSRGPGTALEFALAMVKVLFGAAKAEEVAGPMVLHEGYTV